MGWAKRDGCVIIPQTHKKSPSPSPSQQMSAMPASDKNKRAKAEQPDVAFTALARAPASGQAPCPAIMHHLRQRVCGGNEAALERLLTLWALKHQRPEQKLGCTLVFRGPQGAGKGIIVQLLQRLCGSRLLEVTDLQQVNDRRTHSLMWIVLAEATLPGDEAPEAAADVIVTADEKWVAKDRRFVVHDVQRPEDKGDIASVLAALNAEAPELLHVLLHWPIPEDFAVFQDA